MTEERAYDNRKLIHGQQGFKDSESYRRLIRLLAAVLALAFHMLVHVPLLPPNGSYERVIPFTLLYDIFIIVNLLVLFWSRRHHTQETPFRYWLPRYLFWLGLFFGIFLNGLMVSWLLDLTILREYFLIVPYCTSCYAREFFFLDPCPYF